MPDASDSKRQRLRKAGQLNPHPERVRDPRFRDSPFFDPRDMVQVRYEMVRLVRTGQLTFAEAAQRFGVSLPTCFRAAKAFARDGLQGLIPQRTGPRGPHKITPEIVRFVRDHRARHPRTSSTAMVGLVRERFRVRVSRSGLDKALARQRRATDPDAG